MYTAKTYYAEQAVSVRYTQAHAEIQGNTRCVNTVFILLKSAFKKFYFNCLHIY